MVRASEREVPPDWQCCPLILAFAVAKAIRRSLELPEFEIPNSVMGCRSIANCRMALSTRVI